VSPGCCYAHGVVPRKTETISPFALRLLCDERTEEKNVARKKGTPGITRTCAGNALAAMEVPQRAVSETHRQGGKSLDSLRAYLDRVEACDALAAGNLVFRLKEPYKEKNGSRNAYYKR
jgi:hypothetical protein